MCYFQLDGGILSKMIPQQIENLFSKNCKPHIQFFTRHIFLNFLENLLIWSFLYNSRFHVNLWTMD